MNAHLSAAQAVVEQRKQIVDVLLAGDPASAPGDQYLYSNVGYVIAGAILEAKTGKPRRIWSAPRSPGRSSCRVLDSAHPVRRVRSNSLVDIVTRAAPDRS